jgi:phosphoenolpyruvate phosphomutase
MGNLRALLFQKGSIVGIGAHDGLSGILGERAGFDFIWGSGFEIASSYGVADANLITMTEQLDRCRLIREAVSIPIIADCDNGYGNVVNAIHTALQFEKQGISGICIEDSMYPKRCSFYTDVQRDLVPLKEHASKVRACKENQRTEDFLVIGRTETFIAGGTVDEALERATAYAEAGADAILVHSRLDTSQQLADFAKHWHSPVPLVAVPTTFDDVSEPDLKELGYSVVIYANQGIRSAIFAVERNLRLLRSARKASALRDTMASINTVSDLIKLDQLQEYEKRYL